MTTVLLHGFWGQPMDFNAILNRLPLAQPVLIPDLYAAGPLAPTTVLKDWPSRFWHWVEHDVGGEPVQIVGYSMGARLALSAVLHSPGRVTRALLASGRPRLAADEYAARAEWEKRWAENFLRQDWATLESQWQDQAVFHSSPSVPRRHTPEMREILGLSLTNWSPRLQHVSEEALRALPATVEWAFGALDQNYLAVAKGLQELPVKGQISLIANVGHRVVPDAAEFVSQWIAGAG